MEDRALFYADVPNRLVAYVIDGALIGCIVFLFAVVLTKLLGPAIRLNLAGLKVDHNLAIANATVATLVTGIYFVGSWVLLGGSPGQRLLSMRIAQADDGRRLRFPRAVIRWLLLAPPFGIAAVILGVGSSSGFLLDSTAAGWYLLLLITTSASPSKQGLHDWVANSVVIKAARQVPWDNEKADAVVH